MSDELREKLGKPVSSLKTTLAKISGGLSIALSAFTIAVGAMRIVSGHSVLLPTISGDYIEASGRVVGIGQVLGGIASGYIGKAVWDSASSAAQNRNYQELAKVLDEKEKSLAAGRG